MDKISILRPFNALAYFPFGRNTLAEAALILNQYAGVVCAGWHEEPIDTAAKIAACQTEIQLAINEVARLDQQFIPILPLRLQQTTTRKDVFGAREQKNRLALIIPKKAPGKEDKGLDLKKIPDVVEVLNAVYEADMHLIISAECYFKADGSPVPPLEREASAINAVKSIRSYFPALKLALTASTAAMIDYVRSQEDGLVAAALSPVHALLTFEDMVKGKNQPEHRHKLNWAIPVLNSQKDQATVIRAMISGDERFFLGTGFAPIPFRLKIARKIHGACLGPAELPWTIQIFAEQGKLDRAGNFCSVFGPLHFGLEPAKDKTSFTAGDFMAPLYGAGIQFTGGGRRVKWRPENVEFLPWN